MTAPEVPEEIFKLTHAAIADPGRFLPREYEDRDGERLYETIPHWGARAVVAAALAPAGVTVRAGVAEQMRRAAAGRRHYAASYPPGEQRVYLETEAHTFDLAAKVAEGDPHVIMLALLPVVMWNAAEEARARGGAGRG